MYHTLFCCFMNPYLLLLFVVQMVLIHKMGREVVKVCFLLIILLQFQTGSHNFLNASNIQQVVNKETVFGLVTQKLNSSDSNFTDKLERVLKKENKDLLEISARMNSHDVILFEKKLLQLLGMNTRPKPMRDKDKQKVPKYLIDLYNNQLDAEFSTSNLNLPGRFTGSANTIRSFYNTGTEMDLPGLDAHLRYDLSSIPENEQITGAELQVPFTIDKLELQSMKGLSFQILVHDVVKIPKNQGSKSPKLTLKEPITYPIDSKSIKLSHLQNTTFWLKFDVFPALARLFQNNKKTRKTLGLALELNERKNKRKFISGESSKELLRVKRSLNGEIVEGPILLTYSDDGKNPKKSWSGKTLSRHYRSVQNQRKRRNHRHKNRRRNLCSKKKMFVDFTDVGWNDWIVAPPGYQAFYCSGECPFPMSEHLNATNHAVIQALVNSMNPRLVPPACCAPTKYSSLSLLYTDSSDRIVLKNYNDMIVDSCGCS